MGTALITSFRYDGGARSLKLFYSDGSAVLFWSVPRLVHQTLLRSQDKTAFVQKYLEYNLRFSKIHID
jgi:hypothetical protein